MISELDFADLCPVAADAGPEVCRFRDDAHRLFDGGLPSLPFEGYSGARRIYQCPGTTGMTWKFQPPSGKDSWKRSATRYKIRKVELSAYILTNRNKFTNSRTGKVAARKLYERTRFSKRFQYSLRLRRRLAPQKVTKTRINCHLTRRVRNDFERPKWGGFPPVRSRACNLESGHYVYGVAWPFSERPLSGQRFRSYRYSNHQLSLAFPIISSLALDQL